MWSLDSSRLECSWLEAPVLILVVAAPSAASDISPEDQINQRLTFLPLVLQVSVCERRVAAGRYDNFSATRTVLPVCARQPGRSRPRVACPSVRGK